MTDEEIVAVVGEIVSAESVEPGGQQIDYDEIEAFVQGVTHHEASPGDVRRVAATLAAAGWPLAGIDSDDIWTES